jgi:hypothetical protein
MWTQAEATFLLLQNHGVPSGLMQRRWAVEKEAEPFETPAEFLDALANNLASEEGLDKDLAEILKKHLLNAAPAPNAVAQAKNAIVTLASHRASLASAEAVND